MAGKVRAVPEGHHTVTPHLIIKGAGEAMDFYKKAFGAQEVMRMPGPGGRGVGHGELKFGDSYIYVAEEFPDMKCLSPKSLGGTPVGIHLYVDNVDAAFKQALSAGCKETMPLTNMFWGDRFGKLADPYGHEWSLAQHMEDVPPQEMAKRAEEAFKQMGQKKA